MRGQPMSAGRAVCSAVAIVIVLALGAAACHPALHRTHDAAEHERRSANEVDAQFAPLTLGDLGDGWELGGESEPSSSAGATPRCGRASARVVARSSVFFSDADNDEAANWVRVWSEP